MAEEEIPKPITVLVTGFGAFLDIKVNPSWEIVSRLPSNITTPSSSSISIIAHPEPLKCAYHELFKVVPPLLEQYDPDLVIHIGNAVDRDYFAIEKGADRDGYHQFPDMDRKVFTKLEGKKAWGKSPARLDSNVDLESVLEKWKVEVLGKEKNKKVAGKSEKKTNEAVVDLRTSDDVGSYVCGFVYYTSLEWFWKKGKQRSVLFLHVPSLDEEKDIAKGVKVTTALIEAVVNNCELG